MIAVPSGAACACGQPLPWHLLGLGLGMEHVCSCERAYREQPDGSVVPAGTQPNPFARHDAQQARIKAQKKAAGRTRYTCWTRAELSSGPEVFGCATLHRSRETATRCEWARRFGGSARHPHYVGEVGPEGAVYSDGVAVLTLPEHLLPKWLRVAP